MNKPGWLPLWAWELGHFFAWLVPVPMSGYLCESLGVSLLWSLMIPPSLAILLILWTVEAEILELAQGRQPWKKFGWDTAVKLAAIAVGTLIVFMG